jgi:nucleotide-binding universal stress UspA family protein
MSIKHILVATDLSNLAVPAFARGARLGRERSATVDLLHVVEGSFVAEVREGRHVLAEEHLREWFASVPEVDRSTVRLDVANGEPFAVIIEQAQAHDADLIVLGTPGKKGLRELFVGTTAERVVRHCDRPVLIVKRGAREAYERVLLAVDFSEGASRALDVAYDIAPGAQMLAAHAWQVPAVGLASRQAARQSAEEENMRLRQRIERRARDHLLSPTSPPPRIEMTEGNAFFVIREAIASFKPDLLAMGSHARSGVAIAMVGSLAREFLVQADCDVLVTRA